MFIIVKYGQNESLLCNPMCATINLLSSIKKRAGYGNSNVVVDLSDETGLFYIILYLCFPLTLTITRTFSK
jgi:hypothetical protein